MRCFVLRARKATVRPDKVLSQVGSEGHFEIIAHTLMNAFYVSNAMRPDVEVYVVLDSAADFPRTIRFSSNDGVSFPGFHEQAFYQVIIDTLIKASNLSQGEVRHVNPGVSILGFGFEVLMKDLIEKYPVFLLDKKGEAIQDIAFPENVVFVLSDHLAMPKNSIKSLERKGLQKVSLGRRMLFASQSVVLVHHALDQF